jgi:hypothetical protein
VHAAEVALPVATGALAPSQADWRNTKTLFQAMLGAFNAHHAAPARCARNCDPNEPQNPNTARPTILNHQASPATLRCAATTGR